MIQHGEVGIDASAAAAEEKKQKAAVRAAAGRGAAWAQRGYGSQECANGKRAAGGGRRPGSKYSKTPSRTASSGDDDDRPLSVEAASCSMSAKLGMETERSERSEAPDVSDRCGDGLGSSVSPAKSRCVGVLRLSDEAPRAQVRARGRRAGRCLPELGDSRQAGSTAGSGLSLPVSELPRSSRDGR